MLQGLRRNRQQHAHRATPSKVLAGMHSFKGLVLRAGEDVVADHVVSLEALGPGGVAVVVLPVAVLDVPVVQLGEVVAPHPRAGGDRRAPGAVGLAQQDGQAGTLVTRVALVPVKETLW